MTRLILCMGRCADKVLPKRVVQHPLHTLAMLLWLALGLSLLHTPSIHPWPLLLWPAAENAATAADIASVYVTGALITLSALMFLAGHIFNRVRVAPFLRWLGLWMSVFVCFVLALSIPLAMAQGYSIDPIWPLSVFGWLTIQTIFWLQLLKIVRNPENAD